LKDGRKEFAEEPSLEFRMKYWAIKRRFAYCTFLST